MALQCREACRPRLCTGTNGRLVERGIEFTARQRHPGIAERPHVGIGETTIQRCVVGAVHHGAVKRGPIVAVERREGAQVVELGVVEYDVTTDVAAFANGSVSNFGWLIRKTLEGQSGSVSFGTKEGAFVPQLFIVYQP